MSKEAVWWEVSIFGTDIKPCKVVKETEQKLCIVWGGERWANKDSEHTKYFQTWHQAHSCLMELVEQRLQIAKANVQYYTESLEEIMAMKEPTGE